MMSSRPTVPTTWRIKLERAKIRANRSRLKPSAMLSGTTESAAA